MKMRYVVTIVAFATVSGCWCSETKPECVAHDECPDHSNCKLGACIEGVCGVRTANEGSPGKCAPGLVCIRDVCTASP
jgi:hypothetical protein